MRTYPSRPATSSPWTPPDHPPAGSSPVEQALVAPSFAPSPNCSQRRKRRQRCRRSTASSRGSICPTRSCGGRERSGAEPINTSWPQVIAGLAANPGG
jgi:hypothetical protein